MMRPGEGSRPASPAAADGDPGDDAGALGLGRTEVRVVPHDPAWARLFAQEAALLRATLGDAVIAIEHVGSTSVPGLAAKPILDVAAGVPSLADAAALIPTLRRIGYEHKPDPETPERMYFVKGPPERRTHHLSLAEPGSEFWRQHLRFRDLLRGDPELAGAYERLKLELAERLRGDRPAYTSGKQAFVEAALRRAEGEDG